MAYALADHFGTPDIDSVLALPWPRILEWLEFYALREDDRERDRARREAEARAKRGVERRMKGR